LAPLRVIREPTAAVVGEKELIVGGAVESTSKKVRLPYWSSGPAT